MIFGQYIKEFPIFGKMQYRGSWSGQIYLDAFDCTIDVAVSANKKEGVQPEQSQAMAGFLSNIAEIKKLATQPMLDLYVEGAFEIDFAHFDVWQDLHPVQIEVTNDQYDAQTGKISLLLIFNSQLEADFCPAIEVIDGAFVQVLSGT